MSSKSLNVNAAEFYPNRVKNVLSNYEKSLSIFKKHQENYNCEMAHITQDEIYRQFITDIESGNLNSLDEIKFMAFVIKQTVVAYDKNRWYS